MGLNYLDVGFDWNDLNGQGNAPTSPSSACTMSFGFGGASMADYSSDGGYAQKGSSFIFSIFELSNTPNVKLEKVIVQVQKAPDDQHSHSSPFETDPGTITSFQFGPDPDGHSGPLNATGTGWGTPTYSISYEGSFLLTVQVQASVDGVSHYYQVDPELVVGTSAQGTVFSSQ